MAHRLLQRGCGDDFGIVVRVDFQKAWRDPLASGIQHLGAATFIQRAEAQHIDASVLDADMPQLPWLVAAVKVKAVSNDHVVVHNRLQGASSRPPVTSSNR